MDTYMFVNSVAYKVCKLLVDCIGEMDYKR